ncbi:MAG: hypothetical protein ACYC6G_19250 [Desulfobaccales bacterium]
MSVRFLAQELYRLTRQVEDLERALATLGPEAALTKERSRLKVELLQAKHELAHVRAVLEAKKEPLKI